MEARHGPFDTRTSAQECRPPESPAEAAARRWAQAKTVLDRCREQATHAAAELEQAVTEERDAWTGLEIAGDRVSSQTANSVGIGRVR